MRIQNQFPQFNDKIYVTDGGLETTLIFHEGYELPYFAAFDLLKNASGIDVLRNYYRKFINIAKQHNVGFILESATWRASQDWGNKMGYNTKELDKMNKLAISLLQEIREENQQTCSDIIISGCVGPKGDGYVADELMAVDEAKLYHQAQINSFAQAGVDVISAVTMTNIQEATGICLAAKKANLPVVISFTVETDGHLPTGQTLKSAITQLDESISTRPEYYMINCAHPTHFSNVLNENGNWLERIKGVRANASCKSHAELDECEKLDDGNPEELGEMYQQLKRQLPNLLVLGGCCGTDHRHVENIVLGCKTHNQ